MIGKFKVAALIGAAVAFVGHWVLHFAVAGALFAAIGLGGGHDHSAEAGPDCSNIQRIEAKALTDHECNAGEWHFVINQVDARANAPGQIDVAFANGQTLRVPLEKFTGKVAHYTTYSNLDSAVTRAVAYIYSGWGGQFNLSHGPCGFIAPTPTPTLTPPPGTPTTVPTPAVASSPAPIPPPNPTPTVAPAPGTTPAPDDGVTPAGTSVEQAPVGFPDTGGEPDDSGRRDFGLGARIVLSIIGVGLAIVSGGIVFSYLRPR